MIPKLVVLTGFPASGKTKVSKFMVSILGFARLSGDDISIELFEHTYPYKEDEDPEKIWKRICQLRDKELKQGKNVVIDTTAYSEERRKQVFNTPVQSEKYLVWLRISPETMNARTKERRWSKDSIKEWKDFAGWEDPKQNGYHLLIYKNNRSGDLEHIKSDLRKKLS